MRKIFGGALLVVASLNCLAQKAPAKESPCYKDKSVDEYVVELKRIQVEQKRRGRFAPSSVCVFGHCSGVAGPPGEAPRSPERPSPAQNGAESSSQASAYDPVSAAHNVDVGDYYYQEKNYRGALMRYNDAAKAKPGDAAIHLRLGRGWEKLGAPERAYLEYDAVVKLEPEGKSATEAKGAMERLRPALQKAGVDPATLVAENEPERVPCLAAPAASSR